MGKKKVLVKRLHSFFEFFVFILINFFGVREASVFLIIFYFIKTGEGL